MSQAGPGNWQPQLPTVKSVRAAGGEGCEDRKNGDKGKMIAETVAALPMLGKTVAEPTPRSRSAGTASDRTTMPTDVLAVADLSLEIAGAEELRDGQEEEKQQHAQALRPLLPRQLLPADHYQVVHQRTSGIAPQRVKAPRYRPRDAFEFRCFEEWACSMQVDSQSPCAVCIVITTQRTCHIHTIINHLTKRGCSWFR